MGIVRLVRVGVDLGFIHDPTAIVVVEPFLITREREQDGAEEYAVSYRVRRAERLPLGIQVTDAVERVGRIVDALRERHTMATIEVLVDATGVGQVVKDLLRPRVWRKRTMLWPIIITPGQEPNKKGGTLYVPKEALIQRLAGLLASGQLQIPHTEEALLRELEVFQIKTTPASRKSKFEAAPGEHDDLVIALSLAVWRKVYPEQLFLRPIRLGIGI